MSRNDRRIKKWRSAGTLGELYLKEMAEQGLLLEDMTHLKYIFREDEPQHLRYRIEELEHAPTDEERAEYAKDGWQEVCHYELDYVFAKECSADTFPLQNVHEHQMNFMEKFERQGGIAFFLIYYTARNELYYMQYTQIRKFWDRAQSGGRKSVRLEELDLSLIHISEPTRPY